jgi:hypothetical protein
MNQCQASLGEFTTGSGRAFIKSVDEEADNGEGEELEGDPPLISIYLWLELKDLINECDWLLPLPVPLLSREESETLCENQMKKPKIDTRPNEPIDLTAVQLQSLTQGIQQQQHGPQSQQQQQQLPLPPVLVHQPPPPDDHPNMNRERSEVERNLSEKNYFLMQTFQTKINLSKDSMLTYLHLSTHTSIPEDQQNEYRKKFEEKEKEYYLLSSELSSELSSGLSSER